MSAESFRRILRAPSDLRAAEAEAAQLRKVVAKLEDELKCERAKAPPPPLHCSFCAKSQHDVMKLIAGPHCFICNECVVICVGIICGHEHAPKAQSAACANCLHVDAPAEGFPCNLCSVSTRNRWEPRK